MKQAPHRSSRARRGAAYTEALVMLPVFFTVFAGIHFFHDGYTAKLIAMNEGRSASWEIVNDYGRCGRTSEDGGGPLEAPDEPRSEDVPSGVEDPTTVASDATSAGGTSTEGRAANDVIKSALGSIFGESHVTHGKSAYEMPGYLGGFARTATAKYWTICNPEPKDLGELLKGMLCAVVPKWC